MQRSRLIGWTAFAFCLLGYGVFTALIIGSKMDYLTLKQALMFGAPAAVVGEIGLWVAAGCLGDPRAVRVFVRIEKLDRIPGALGVEMCAQVLRHGGVAQAFDAAE